MIYLVPKPETLNFEPQTRNPMNQKEKFISNLTSEQQETLRQHFDTIYECPEMTEHEFKIAYLAWLWANGKVYNEGDMGFNFYEEETGIPMEDYEITFEDNYEEGGINLDYIYRYYSLEELIEKMNW